jgi:hypothetical protein
MYLRHEAGHAFNYAYRLYQTPEWRELFGPFNRPYRERYRPIPFDRNFVRHIEGWYAQKHPDEDFAETFAVWLTPGSRWRVRYRGSTHVCAPRSSASRVPANMIAGPLRISTTRSGIIGSPASGCRRCGRATPRGTHAFRAPRWGPRPLPLGEVGDLVSDQHIGHVSGLLAVGWENRAGLTCRKHRSAGRGSSLGADTTSSPVPKKSRDRIAKNSASVLGAGPLQQSLQRHL